MLTTPSTTLSEFLGGVIADPVKHARFLNTLSLLEHIGSRKILLTQGETGGEDALKHLAEETRHAHFFRKAAEKVAGRPLTYSDQDAAAPHSARMYFGRLDSGISAETGPGALAYLYVTQAIEVRAHGVYGLYEKELRAAGHSLTLRSVIAEEDAHLAAMEAALRRLDPRYGERSARFAALEAELFCVWLAKTAAACGVDSQ